MLPTHRVLLLPGWRNSGSAHWQSRWQTLYAQQGFSRVEQADWDWPLRGDWMARLDEAVLSDPSPALLAAHSLGCQLVAAWAGHSRHTHRVVGALLVAPPDTARADTPPQLASWRLIARTLLPFAAQLVYSRNDPFCAPERALAMAANWGAAAHDLGDAGHINADSGLGDWPQGLQWLQSLYATKRPASA